MTRIVQGIDGKVLRKLRHNLFEQVQLCSERVEKHNNRTCARSDEAELVAADLHIFEGNVGGPGQLVGALRRGPQRFDDLGDYDQRNEGCQHAKQYRRQAHGLIP